MDRERNSPVAIARGDVVLTVTWRESLQRLL